MSIQFDRGWRYDLGDGYYILKLGVGEIIVNQYDDYCTGSRVESALTTVKRVGTATYLQNQGKRPVYVLVNQDGGFVHDDLGRLPIYAHIRDAVACKAKNNSLRLVRRSKPFPSLRWACMKAGMQPIRVPGGRTPLYYKNQVAVPNFVGEGSTWFIVPKKHVGALLAQA